ncbi:hypothetical protein Y032_0014g2446 [Ancylostoma ceylanicum]|nr:hypothetical protein Y032_0014g2446 [Ancylostoma ceylanicum]
MVLANHLIQVMLIPFTLTAAINIRNKKQAQLRHCHRYHSGTYDEGCSMKYRMTGDHCEGYLTLRTTSETTESLVRVDDNTIVLSCPSSQYKCLQNETLVENLIIATTGKSGPLYGGDVFLYCFANVIKYIQLWIKPFQEKFNKGEDLFLHSHPYILWPPREKTTTRRAGQGTEILEATPAPPPGVNERDSNTDAPPNMQTTPPRMVPGLLGKPVEVIQTTFTMIRQKFRY